MISELARYDAPLTAQEIKAQVGVIQSVMSAVMKNGTHYGTIPGCGDKKALFKAGAEKILSTFRIAVDPEIEDLSRPDVAHYRCRCKGITPNGNVVGVGVGECSSDEEKYRWKRAVCEEEFDATPDDLRRVKWFAPSGKAKYSVKQIRTWKADVANTVLRMAKKRAMVDMCLTATAASDCFTQDVLQTDEERVDGAPAPESPSQRPQRVTGDVTAIKVKPTTTGGKRYGLVVGGKTYYTFDEKVMDIGKQSGTAKRKVQIDYVVGDFGADIEQIAMV